MFYSYAELEDETQFAYSEMREDGTVEFAIERPVDMGFDTAHCLMPAYRWFDVRGFSEDEMARLDSFVRDNAPLIFEFAERRAEEQAQKAGRKEPAYA